MPQSSPASSAEPLVQREYAETATRLESAPPEATPNASAPTATHAPEALHSDQSSGLSAVSPTTSTPNPVQRVLDAAPPKTTPLETNLEAVPPAQSLVDQPSLQTTASEVSVQREPERFERLVEDGLVDQRDRPEPASHLREFGPVTKRVIRSILPGTSARV